MTVNDWLVVTSVGLVLESSVLLGFGLGWLRERWLRRHGRIA